MADIEVKIQLQDTVEDSIRVISSPNDVNNASIQKVETAFNRLSVLNDGMNLKSWSTGSLSLADGVVGGSDTSLVEQYGYEGYVFGAVPESKEFPVTIQITGRDIDNIIVYGDKEANQFPTKAYRDSNPNDIIYNNDVDWDISFNDQANTHTITFLEWNRANYNACISHISVKSLSLILGKKWIKNVESLSQSTDRPNEIYYGVLPNSGNLSLVDIDGSLKNYAEEGHFDDANLSIGIFANGKEVKRHISSDSHYDNVARTLEVNLGDALSSWEELQYKGFAYPKKSENAYNMLLDVFVSIGYKQNQVDKMLSTEIVYGVDNQVGSVKQYLQEITIPYPYLPSASVRETIDKFCVLAQLQVYKTDRNEIKFVSARPRATTFEKTNVIHIGESRMFENFTKAILLKNKYDSIQMSEMSGTQEYDYDAPIYNSTSYNNEAIFDSANLSDATMTSARIDAYYTSGSFFIPESEDLGKIQYLTFSNKNDYSSSNTNKYYRTTKDNLDTINIDNYLGNTTNPLDFETMVSFSKYGSVTPEIDSGVEYSSNKVYEKIKGTIYNVDINNYSSYFFTNYNEDNKTFSFIVNDKVNNRKVEAKHIDKSTINVTEVEGGYNVEYNVLIKIFLCGYYVSTTGTPIRFSYLVSEKKSEKLEITLYGDKKTLVFKDISVNDDISNSTTIVSIQSSELIQSETVYKSIKMSDIIKTNIKEDYATGISNATLSVPCLDYYNENGEKVKDWSKGEMLEVHDIIRVQGDNTLWRITGRNFRKQGIPMLDLELQQIKE